MIIYRCHEEGRPSEGPFNNSSMRSAFSEAIENDVMTWEERDYIYNHPNPYSDGLHVSHSEVCACSSVQQFNEWFPPKLQPYLTKRGMVFKAYEVPAKAVQRGSVQVLVDLSHLTPDNEVPFPCSSTACRTTTTTVPSTVTPTPCSIPSSLPS